MGVRPSMGSVGDAYDDAMCESFFATLEWALLDRHRFPTHADARMAVAPHPRAPFFVAKSPGKGERGDVVIASRQVASQSGHV